MIERKYIEPSKALEYLAAIEPHLYRYPAIDPASFRSSAEEILAKG
jgi:hypothetical protein